MADVYGTDSNDKLVGTRSNDNLYGRAGNDIFTGGGGNDYVWGESGADVVKFQPGQGSIKWYDFQDGSDKIDAQGLAFNRLGFSYDSTWKYTWIHDPNGARTLGLKNITPDKVTAADFINLGSGSGTSGSSAPPPKAPSGGDNSISARNGMPKIWQDNWAGKLARGDLNPDRYFDPVPGNNNWQSHNSGHPDATAKSLVWTSEAADRPNIGKHAAMALTAFKGVQGGYNAFTNATSYFDEGYDKMSVAADFYFPTSYKMESATQPGATIDAKGMFGLYATAKGIGKLGGTPPLRPSMDNQNAAWIETTFKQNPVFGKDGYGGNNLRLGLGATDLDRSTVGLELKATAQTAIPKGKWVPLELYAQVDTNGHNGIARLYQNGQLIAQATDLDLGGARYGWKLHGFTGAWMWGGAGEKYVPTQTETFYIKNMRIYDDPPTGEGAVASPDDTMDEEAAMAAFGEANMHDNLDPVEATKVPVIVTADASGTPDYLTATAVTEAAVTEAAAAEAAAAAEKAPAEATEDAAPPPATAPAEAPAEVLAEAEQKPAAAPDAAVEVAAVPADDAAPPSPQAADTSQSPPAADSNTVAAAPEILLEATEDALATMLVPAHDPADLVHIA